MLPARSSSPAALAALALACAAAAPLPAQTAPAVTPRPGTGTGTGDTIVTLSPFEVSAAQDTGYVAQNTLAGSRVRTNLKDIAAAISPMTEEFLQDIAATNIIEAMEYGMNSRVETDDGRAAGPVADSYTSGIREIRVRGLPGGSRTVNYFRLLGEVDAYNTGRLEVSRGPNSILYGFGSPAGVINAGTKTALTHRSENTVSFRADSWKGYRATFDANVALIRHQLAVRAVHLLGREGSWRAAGHNHQDRSFLTATWTPDRKTTIRADFEYAYQNRFVPRPFHSVDQITLWMQAGQPSFTNFNLALAAGAVGTPGNPFRDTGATQVTGVEEIANSSYIVVSDAFPYALDYFRFTRSERLQPTGNYGAFDLGRTNPKAVLEANWLGAIFRSRRFAAAVQREVLPDFNVEFGVSQQRWEQQTRNLSSWDRFGVIGDPNTHYPDGTPKPAANRYYFENKADIRTNLQDLRQVRSTLAYERELGRLGKLRLAGLAEWTQHKNRTDTLEPHWFNGPSVTSGGAFAPDPLNAANRVYWRNYLPDLALLNDPNYRMPGPTDVSQGVTVYNAATRQTRTIYGLLINRAQGNIDYWNERQASYMGVAQLFTLNNRVVLTGGLRDDTLKHYEADAIRDPAGIAAGNPGIWIPVLPPGTPASVLSGQTFTAGGVVHLTRWLSGFYNTSKSVNVPGDIRVFGADPANPQPNVLAPLRDGRTYDYGLKLDLLKNKLFVTATRFTTQAHNDVGFSGFSARGDIVQIWRTLNESGALPASEATLAAQMFEYTNRTQGYLLDAKTRGYEFEVVGEPLPGWSVSLNYSQTESTRENIAPRVRAHVDQWKPLWLKYRDFTLSQNANLPGPERGSFADFRPREQADALADFTVNTDTINERVADLENNFFNNPYVFEGNRFIGDNKHNLNLRTRYAFRQGGLRGLAVGGGMRLRVGRVAGAIPTYDYVSNDITERWNGRQIASVRLIEATDQALFDFQVSYRRKLWTKVDWTIQLNIDNVLDADDFIVNNTHSRTGAPTTYRYQDPRKFILTNSFTF